MRPEAGSKQGRKIREPAAAAAQATDECIWRILLAIHLLIDRHQPSHHSSSKLTGCFSFANTYIECDCADPVLLLIFELGQGHLFIC